MLACLLYEFVNLKILFANFQLGRSSLAKARKHDISKCSLWSAKKGLSSNQLNITQTSTWALVSTQGPHESATCLNVCCLWNFQTEKNIYIIASFVEISQIWGLKKSQKCMLNHAFYFSFTVVTSNSNLTAGDILVFDDLQWCTSVLGVWPMNNHCWVQ